MKKEGKISSFIVRFFPPTASADAQVLQAWVCRICVCACVCVSLSRSQTALNKSCSVDVDGIRDSWNSLARLLFVRWEQSRTSWGKIALSVSSLRPSVRPAAETTLLPWKLKYAKTRDGMGVVKTSGWVHIRQEAAVIRQGQKKNSFFFCFSTAVDYPLSENDSS